MWERAGEVTTVGSEVKDTSLMRLALLLETVLMLRPTTVYGKQ